MQKEASKIQVTTLPSHALPEALAFVSVLSLQSVQGSSSGRGENTGLGIRKPGLRPTVTTTSKAPWTCHNAPEPLFPQLCGHKAGLIKCPHCVGTCFVTGSPAQMCSVFRLWDCFLGSQLLAHLPPLALSFRSLPLITLTVLCLPSLLPCLSLFSLSVPYHLSS